MFQKTSHEDVCNIGLGLGLGSHRKPENKSKPDFELKKLGLSPCFEPSLTLGLSEETYQAMEAFEDGLRQASPQSDISTFYDTKVMKRKREVGSEEMMEVERVCKRLTSDEDEEGYTRKKLRLTKEQSALLEDNFKENNTLNPKRKIALAKQLNLRPRQVEVWFQNRRARTKLKQTEVDCEYLKKYCEALTHENKRLQKELHELKALKAAPQFYMHLPAATLTMCPSCERLGDTDRDTVNRSSRASFIVAKETELHNPFDH